MKISRRDFFRASAMTAAAAGLGGCGSFSIGRRDPRRPMASERVNLAVIGCGAMAYGNAGAMLNDPRVQVTVVCDPIYDSKRCGYDGKSRAGRKPFKEMVDRRYKNGDCAMVADWREAIADPSVDAVLIVTTDHWHAIISAAAMRAGKHVYCQKPLTLGVSEGIALTKIAKETGVTFQVGSQQRSASEFRIACELVRNGYLGDCKSCTIGLTYPHNDSRKNGYARDNRRLAEPPADYFASKELWDLWQGPAERWEGNAFIPGIHSPVAWRWNWRYGSGTIADWGAHHFDIMQWALGTERSGPAAIENFECDWDPPGEVADRKVFSTPYRFSFDVVYANGFRAHVCDTEKAPQGVKFHSKQGDLFVTRGKIELPKHLEKWDEDKDLKGSDVKLYRTKKGTSHEKDFVDGIYHGGRIATDCEIGHRSATIAHLGNICARLGVKGLQWDPERECAVGANAAAANELCEVKHHNGWSI